jgi:hypothetical protein
MVMNRLARTGQALSRRYMPRTAAFEGSNGTALFIGTEPRAPSIAEFFCGPDQRGAGRGRILSNQVPDRITQLASAGGLALLATRDPDARLAEIMPYSVAVPSMVDIHRDLPADTETLRDELVTSTTREDFRRIRKAGFTYRVANDPDAIREFHARHYTPMLANRYPDDGRTRPLDKMLADLDKGGEVVCADIEDEWVAGIFNMDEPDLYAMMTLGIRDADDDVRKKRVVSALIIRSLERAVELGRNRATLGSSVPFLGKGPVWFKAKWGGVITTDPRARHLDTFMDLRHAAVRSMLSSSPIIHRDGDELAVSLWLEPGEKPLKATTRDAGRFPGISRWYVLGEPETLDAGADQLAATEGIVTVPLTPRAADPIWLGEVLGRVTDR